MHVYPNDEGSLKITEDLITSKPWVLSQGGLIQKNPIMFCIDGRIARYAHVNERYWAVSDEELRIYHEDRSVSSVFKDIKTNKNNTVISGFYMRDGHNIPLYIEQREFESKPFIVKDYEKSSENVVMFVAFFHKGQLPAHTDILLREFKQHDVDVIIIICVDKEFEGAILSSFESQIAQFDGAICRSNYGYDFSAWADCLRLVPNILNAQKLIFMNDSLIGPLGRLDDLFSRIKSHTEDFLGISFSWAIRPHIQSYFMVIQGSALNNANVRQFWRSIQEISKKEIILEYETRLFSYMQSWELSIALLYWGPEADGCGLNDPSGVNWERLLSTGFPFIKSRIVKNKEIFTASHVDKYFSSSELRSILALELAKGDR